MNASVRTRHASLSLWEASVEQTLSLCNASALKRRQTLWEYADVTPAVAHSQTRCPLIDSWMIREPTTLMHAMCHLASDPVFMNVASSSPPRRNQGLEISYELFRKKRHDLVFREVPPHSANLNVNHLLSLRGPWKLLIFRKHSVCSLLRENSEVCFSQDVVSLPTVDIILFFVTGSPWNYCYNPLHHEGELKGKVLNAGCRKNQQTGTEREIRVPLHQAEGRVASPFCVPHTTDLISLLLGVFASCSSQTRVVLWAQRTPVWDFLMFLIWEWMRPRRSQSSPKKTITIQSLANEACRLKGHGRFAKK